MYKKKELCMDKNILDPLVHMTHVVVLGLIACETLHIEHSLK